MELMNFIINSIFRNPPVLLGLIAALGLALQKKPFGTIVKGALMTAFGMVILNTGVSMLVQSILPINTAFQSLNGTVAEGLNDATFTASFGGDIGMAMFIGMILHLLIARFTPVKTIFLTGHMLWWFPFIFVAAGVEGGLRGMPLILFGAICSALYWSLMPWALKKYTFAVTQENSFLLGHPTGYLGLISGFVASKVGNKEKSTEDIQIPKALSFFREISITGCLVIFVMFVIVGLTIPTMLAAGENVVVVAIAQGLNYGAGLILLLQGVRMLISQIVPAFKGISEKVVPNAIPAYDCPMLFTYKPNAVLIGFVVAMITSTVLILICNATQVFGIMLVPLVITSFFECGTAAILGEGQGGLRGAVIGTFVAAAVMVVMVGFSALAYSHTIANWMLINAGNDFSLFGMLAKAVASLLSGIF